MIAQGSHANQVQFPSYPVIEHGKFIQPRLSHKPAQAGNTEITLEFSTLLQVIFLVHILLKIFGIGMHSPEFIDIYITTTHPHPAEFDKGPVRWALIKRRGFYFLRYKNQSFFNLFYRNYPKTAETKPAQHFSL